MLSLNQLKLVRKGLKLVFNTTYNLEFWDAHVLVTTVCTWKTQIFRFNFWQFHNNQEKVRRLKKETEGRLFCLIKQKKNSLMPKCLEQNLLFLSKHKFEKCFVMLAQIFLRRLPYVNLNTVKISKASQHRNDFYSLLART